MLAPVAWRVPPRHYGPWELVVSRLTEGLVARGVDVTLFATADSLTSARLVAVCERPYEEDPGVDAKVAECLHVAAAFERAGELDLLHNHFDFLPLTFTELVDIPVVTTIHGFSSERILPVYRRYDERVAYVAISDADRHADLSYAATIHHGTPVDDVPVGAGSDDGTLAFFGRIHPHKGAKEAIEVAHRTGRPLVLAGIVQDEAYFDAEVRPHLDGDQVRFLGALGPSARDELLGSADALLHLVSFAEPFGLSMIEAMACGTPVIATPLGAVPEVVADGRTGHLVADVDAAVDAVGRLDRLSRSDCRAHVAEHFSVDRMVDRYLDLYWRLCEGDRRSTRPSVSRASTSADTE